jgi:hypothetical protein
MIEGLVTETAVQSISVMEYPASIAHSAARVALSKYSRGYSGALSLLVGRRWMPRRPQNGVD